MQKTGIILGLLVLGVLIFGCTAQTTFSTDNTSKSPSPSVICTPSWSCAEWSNCSANGTQTRICSDSNKCEVITEKPIESQTCISEQQKKAEEERLLNEKYLAEANTLESDSNQILDSIGNLIQEAANAIK